MISSVGSGRSVLQRRSHLSNSLQAMLDGSAVLALAWFLINQHIGVITSEYVVLVLLLLGTLGIVYDQFAIYRTNASFSKKALSIFNAWTLTFFVLVVLGFLTKQSEVYSRLLLTQLYVGGYLLQLLLHLIMRFLMKNFMKHAFQPENAIIVGTGRLATYLEQKVSLNPWLGERIVGCVSLPPQAAIKQEDKSLGEPNIIGELADLIPLIEKHGVRTVYFAIPLDSSEILEDLYFKLLDKHVAVHWVPDIFSLRLVNHSVREIAGLPVLTLSETPLTGTRLILKTLEDFVLSIIILVLIAPILCVVAIMIKLDSPGPVFFRQPRMGWNGKPFRIWKFRSMHVHPVENGIVKQAEKDDPRITKVGRFIRRTSLDELPQVFNVILGEMSLVGPRPHAIQHDEEYSLRINDYFARHNIKPGITGLAQVRGYRGETKELEQMIQRVESDIEYINNWSLWLDLSILVRTTNAFTGKNAY